MLSGDRKPAVEALAASLGIGQFLSEKLPR
jgi:cation transport ATPase